MTSHRDRHASDTASPRPRVGVAVSGGGFRATAFGLGCFRALHKAGVLPLVRVVSGVSGGSILAAAWAYGPADFDEFDHTVQRLLTGGLQQRLVLGALSPRRLGHRGLDLVASATRRGRERPSHNRTDVLADLLTDLVLGNRLMPDTTHPDVSTVIAATDLVTSRAVRFGSRLSSLSTYGTIVEPIPVALAVAASAAYPLAFPAVQRTYTFRKEGSRSKHRVALTDGGVYDNLGLAVLEQTRSSQHSDHVYPLDYVIASDAGRQELGRSQAALLPARLTRSYAITYRKTQDGTRNRLHMAATAGDYRGVVHSYLGQRDERLPMPIPDLVQLQDVNDYPTNLAAVAELNLRALTARGEQLTAALLLHYCPELVLTEDSPGSTNRQSSGPVLPD
ncbi:hypothetical protein ASG36_20755 [Geodermatophilus sp. Leaf369]|nr:hypothetical protein ASG36_20755 [Geodermatophilus sp. Leaf369]